MSPTDAIMLAGAVVLAAGGAYMMALWRAPDAVRRPAALRRLSVASHAVIGLALLFAAYHLFAHAIALAHMRAPLWLALAGSAIAIGATLAIDALERAVGSEEGE